MNKIKDFFHSLLFFIYYILLILIIILDCIYIMLASIFYGFLDALLVPYITLYIGLALYYFNYILLF